jgi:hypothetical protein
MSWASKRRLIYLGSIAFIFIILVVWIFIAYFYKAPTCFDGKQNQTELGVDCGGPCTLLCSAQYVPLTVKWSRFFKVTEGDYNVLAYIENPNLNAVAYNLDYSFKLYDKNGVLLRERFGKTFAPANKIMAVFEPDLQTGNNVPSRVEFSFLSKAVWLKQESMETGLGISQSVISREDTAPRLSALLTNKTINQISNIEAIAIVYNAEGNTVAFSRTVIDSIVGKDSLTINFNWPRPFAEAYARTEIILKVLK